MTKFKKLLKHDLKIFEFKKLDLEFLNKKNYLK